MIDVQMDIDRSASGVAAEERRRQLATAASLRPFFRPSGVAVVGASREPSALGRRVFDALVAAGLLTGGAHPRRLGLVDELPWMQRQQRLTFARVGVESLGSTPDELAAAMKGDMAKWGALIRQRGIRVQ